MWKDLLCIYCTFNYFIDLKKKKKLLEKRTESEMRNSPKIETTFVSFFSLISESLPNHGLVLNSLSHWCCLWPLVKWAFAWQNHQVPSKPNPAVLVSSQLLMWVTPHQFKIKCSSNRELKISRGCCWLQTLACFSHVNLMSCAVEGGCVWGFSAPH